MQQNASFFSRTVALSDDGLILGDQTRLARFAEGTSRLTIDAERVTGLIATALHRQPSERDLSAIETAAIHWQRGDKALANLRLVFAGLPQLEAPQDVYRLKAAELLFDAGLTASDLATQLGKDEPGLGKHDPDQPRVPAGSGRTSGRWTDGLWGRFSAWLDEEVPVYDQDTGDEVGTQSRAIATNPLTILGVAGAVLAGGELLAPVATAADATAAANAAVAAAPAAEEAETLTPFAQRYISTSGGRLGITTTRQQLYEIARAFLKSGKYEKFDGDGQGPEEYIPGPGPGTKGSTYVDFTARTSDGSAVRIQTIDTPTDGVTPTKLEVEAAARIRSARPDDHLILVPKQKP